MSTQVVGFAQGELSHNLQILPSSRSTPQEGRVKGRATDREMLHVRHANKGLVFKIHKELSAVSKDEQNPIQIRTKTWIDISSDTWLAKKKKHTHTLKKLQHHSSLRKCKLKPQL